MSDAAFQFDLDALDGRVTADPGAPEFPALAEALRRSGAPDRARDVALAGLESAPSRLAGRVALALAQMDLGAPELGRRELECVLDEMLEPYRLDAEPEAELTPIDREAESELEQEPIVPEAEAAAAPSGATPEGEALDALGEHEIDAAFEEAESRAEEMYSPNTTAERVLEAEAPVAADVGAELQQDRREEREGAYEAAYDSDDLDGEDDFDFASSQTFSTRTMAGLLERQGDRGRAESIRSVIEGAGGDEAREPAPGMDAAALPDPIEPAAAGAGDEKDRQRVLATLERWLHNLGRGVA